MSTAPSLIVVKADAAAARREFMGVSFDVLATGPQSMIAVMHYRADNHVPFHTHPNEQSGYVLSGRIRVVTRDGSAELGPGDTYSVPANVEHSIEILEAAEEVVFFTPPRADYL